MDKGLWTLSFDISSIRKGNSITSIKRYIRQCNNYCNKLDCYPGNDFSRILMGETRELKSIPETKRIIKPLTLGFNSQVVCNTTFYCLLNAPLTSLNFLLPFFFFVSRPSTELRNGRKYSTLQSSCHP